ncbi:MAG TPA: histidinol-phosphatase [Clostridia bacterium]|nr:histidinol-phosphatase [Clostridia bacterium]
MNTRNKIKTDYHVHPDYSPDAAPFQVRDYCEKALDLGLREICFTTHLDIDPVREHLDNYVFLNGKKHPVRDLIWLDKYVEEILAARKEFAGHNLKVKTGIEVSYVPGLEKEIETILLTYPFDFVLGGIHTLDHIDLSWDRECHLYFGRHSLEQIKKDYFSTLREAVQTKLFDCIAHLDIYKRYGIKFHGPEILTIHRDVVEPILEEMAQNNSGLEINTSSLRKGMDDFLPSREIIALAAQAGVKIFTVGSDAHHLDDLGAQVEDALQLLQELGLNNHVFNQRKPSPCL